MRFLIGDSMIKIGIIPTLLAILLVVACTAEPTPTPVQTPISTPVVLPAATHTPVPTPTNTPIPTNTPVATPTSMPVPTNTPVPTPTSTPMPTSTPTNTPVPIPTATPTQTPTPTARPLLQGQFPPLPSVYNGSVTIDGTPVPDGVAIEARILWYISKTVTTFDGRYQGLVISPNDWTMDTRPITFYIGNVQANESTIFTGNVYGHLTLDLSFPALTD